LPEPFTLRRFRLQMRPEQGPAGMGSLQCSGSRAVTAGVLTGIGDFPTQVQVLGGIALWVWLAAAAAFLNAFRHKERRPRTTEASLDTEHFLQAALGRALSPDKGN
jgi:hypothetical protein